MAYYELIHDAKTVGCHYTEPSTGDSWSTRSGPVVKCAECGTPIRNGYVRYHQRAEAGVYCPSHVRALYLS